jgi:hypothetical protein
MNLCRIIIGIALMCVWTPGCAQATDALPVEHAGQDLDGPLGQLPESMFGIECRVSNLDGVVASGACWDPSRGPVVSVNSYALGRELSYGDLGARMRENFRTAGSLQVIEEGPFPIASAPDATTMRGIYQTETAARKFTWSASHQGNLTRVILTVADDAKIEDFEGEVLTKVFGPDRYVPDVSAAP